MVILWTVLALFLAMMAIWKIPGVVAKERPGKPMSAGNAKNTYCPKRNTFFIPVLAKEEFQTTKLAKAASQ